MKAIKHGLLAGCPPPSIPLLNEWLDAHGVERSDGVRVAPMADGSGWRVLATRDLEIGETSESGVQRVGARVGME